MNTKKAMIVALLAATSMFSFAGGLLTNTNQNASFLRNPARGASTEVDAVYTNPAGLAFTEEGFQFSINNQSAFQTRTIHTTYAPFAAFGGNETKEYEGKAKAWLVPSVQAVYKTGRWAFSGSFAIVGGGGTIEFANGLGSFESSVAKLPSMLPPTVLPTSKYSMESNLLGTNITYGGQLGISYRITDYLSAYAGARMNYVSNAYNGYIRNIQTDTYIPQALGGTGIAQMRPASEAFRTYANHFNTLAANYPVGSETYIQMKTLAATATALSGATQDKVIDVAQKGFGFAPIVGLHFQMGAFDFGAKYEFRSAITLKNATISDAGMAQYADGAESPSDIPALLSLGGSYRVTPKLKVMAGYHHFFDSEAKMAGDKQNFTGNGTHEYLAGAEYQLTSRVLLSVGGQRTKYDVRDEYQSDMSFAVSSYSLGGGVAIALMKNLRLNLAYLHTFYEDYTKVSSQNNVPYTELFNRTNTAFGIGLDFKF